MKNCVMNVSDGDAYSPSNAKLDVGLISLTICECTLPRDSIELLLCETPLLRHFKLVCHRTTFDSIFDGLDWELFIRNNLPALEKFEFFFSYRCKRPDPFHGLSSGIASFQSRFWLEEKHWFVVAANPIKLPEFWLYTRPLSNIDYATSQARYELASINDGYRLIARPIDAISHTDLNVIDCIKFTQALIKLDLGQNTIDEAGAQFLAVALKMNTTLTSLSLRSNLFGQNGRQCLVNALEQNTTLTIYDLGDDLTETETSNLS
ncbi:unnamed protein product [Rotaria socialis]|uniref:Uncharacterized protein n=1 Tax=Rotaria socialis TaxID=392032 RepID=A0A818F9U1_9BILA|nr:unnamed protein product [Rotaria socialis]